MYSRKASGFAGGCLLIAISLVLAGCGSSSSSSTTTTATPAVSLSATSLSFSTVVGAASAAQTVTLTDTGTAEVTFSSFTPSPAANFSQSNNCTGGLAVEAACTVSVTFTSSTAVTALSGSLTISDNAGTQTITLSGTAATPTASVSPTSLSFGSQAVGTSSPSQAVTLSNSGTVAVAITSITVGSNYSQTNNCGSSLSVSSSCTINVVFAPTTSGSLPGTLAITDNASSSPQTVSLTGTGTTSSVSLSANSLRFAGVLVGSTAPPQSVTLTNGATTPLAISGIAVTSGASDFSQSNTCAATVAASGNCMITVSFTPSAIGTRTGAVTITDNANGVAGSTQTISLTGAGFTNTASVSVNLGLTGNYANGIFVTVTVCAPGTSNCTSVPDVLVDTGSVGLRLLGSDAEDVATQVANLNLPQVTDPNTSLPLYECVEFGDLSHTWGPVELATVQIGGETAVQVPGGTANAGIPIQVISTGTVPEYASYEGTMIYNTCLSLPGSDDKQLSNGGDYDTVAELGSNGILGVGRFPQDCTYGGTNYCTTIAPPFTGQYMAYNASTGDATIEPVALTNQLWNPVTAFPVDNNGVQLSLPAVPANGASTAAGTLTFGIGTESNNAITTQTVYELDSEGHFASATYNNVNYTSSNSGGSFLDSGSNGLYVSDASTLGISACSDGDSAFYCPSSTTPLAPLTLQGSNSASTSVSLSIANAETLAGSGNAAFNDLAGQSCIASSTSSCNTSTDYWDLGLPFFFGLNVFVGISGTNASYPNGYWAF